MNSDDSGEKVAVAFKVPLSRKIELKRQAEERDRNLSGHLRRLVEAGEEADQIRQETDQRIREAVEETRDQERERTNQLLKEVREEERERAQERIEEVREEESGFNLTLPSATTLAAIGVALTAADPLTIAGLTAGEVAFALAIITFAVVVYQSRSD